MSRAPSKAELTRALLNAAAAPHGEELHGFLLDYGPVLERILGLSESALHGTLALSAEQRRGVVQSFVERARWVQREQRKAECQRVSLAAAEQLARRARWTTERIDLDVGIVLGKDLLADSTKQAIQFVVEGQTPLNVLRSKLIQARRVLRFADLGCFIDVRGLNFRWRGGKGGLVLHSQELDRNDRDSVVPVVLRCPSHKPVAGKPPVYLSEATLTRVSRALTDVCFAS